MDRMPRIVFTDMPYCFTNHEDVERCVSKINAAGFEAETDFFKASPETNSKSFWKVTAKKGKM